MDDRQIYANAGLLMTVWSEWADDENGYAQRNFTVDEFADTLRELSIAELVTDADVARFIDYAVSNGFGTLVQTRYARARVKFNPRAIFQHAIQLDAKDPARLAYELGLQWVIESLQNIPVKPLPTERLLRESTGLTMTTHQVDRLATSDAWEPLPIDRERPSYEEMVRSLDAIVEATRSDNGYSATYPDERNAILELLTSGRRLLVENVAIVRYQVEVYLLQPLKRLTARFSNAAIDVIAKKAIEAVWVFFFGG